MKSIFDEALLNAAWAGDVCGVVLMLKLGADPNARDLFGNALQYALTGQATDEERVEICDLLVYYGAEPYLENCAGETAAETAMKLGLLSLYVRWLYREWHAA